jgi:hypothetical protein
MAGARGGPRTSRDLKKDCGEPGCPNDHRSEVLAGGDKVIEQERRLPLLARNGPPAMSDLSPLSRAKQKLDFGDVRAVDDRT